MSATKKRSNPNPRYRVVAVLVCLTLMGCRGFGETPIYDQTYSSSTSNAPPIEISETPVPASPQAADETFEEVSSEIGLNSHPIDFPTVLRLAGADNWNIRIAQQRVKEAAADYCAAKSAWMPSLNLGLGFNHHEGELQNTEGDVITVSRSSLFLGAGAGVQDAPLTAGAGGPPRMFVDFSLADAIFAPLAARRILGAQRAENNRIFNDTMLQASLAYYELVQAQAQSVVDQTNLNEAVEVAELTQSFVSAGKGTEADINRVAVIVNQRKQQLVASQAEMRIASAQLANILQLDPAEVNPETGLVAMDATAVPLELVGNPDLNHLIQQAQFLRCEVAEANAQALAAQSEMLAEQWRPWLPNLYVGYSGGAFGGGRGGDFAKLDGRGDFDLAINWQVRNLGVGARARQDASRSRMYQRNLETHRMRDQIAEQVTTTYNRVQQFRTELTILQQNVEMAGSGLAKNLDAIKGLEGLPLEALASLQQMATARRDYLTSVINYNQWQVRLLRASGQPLSPGSNIATMANCDPCMSECDTAKCPHCLDLPKCRCRNRQCVDQTQSGVTSVEATTETDSSHQTRIPIRNRLADRKCGLISGTGDDAQEKNSERVLAERTTVDSKGSPPVRNAEHRINLKRIR